ncbi:predicted protein [Naegleria gruberi]|uniref:Predicted protein n=1 Tax=Naegleria gruberi TaxID=5762 RepID=D2VEJ3_NAEGR|nr:uncharacterized protein NAEGRDRAFT_67298 [Naegleria gruberi]EFC44891.1 predicted protein [Naegleria gruberi]|eukprot:XP_002677635.1 predicted protein [Naegleria gruberi strain NEG-M]
MSSLKSIRHAALIHKPLLQQVLSVLTTHHSNNRLYHHQDSTKESITISSVAANTEAKCPYHKEDGTVDVAKSVAKPFGEIPGPKPLPILGNYLDIKKHSKNTMSYFLDLCNEYGEMVKLTALNKNMVIISNPYWIADLARVEERRTVLNPSRYYKESRGYEMVPIEMKIEENWNEIRQIFNLAMKPEFLDQIVVPQLTEMNSDLIRQLKKNFVKVGENQFRLDDGLEATSRYAFDAIMKIFFGVKMTEELEKSLPFKLDDFSKKAITILDLCGRLDYKFPLYKYFKTEEYKTLESYYDQVIDNARYCVERFGASQPENAKPRFYEILVKKAEGATNSNEKVSTVLSTFIQGGVDITSRIMNFILYRLAHHPEYQEKLYNECLEVFGPPALDEVSSENGLIITPEQYKQLKLVRQFVEEVLRFNSFAYITMGRQLNSDIEIGGYILPKETIAIFMNYYPSMKDEYVPRALEFIPERHEKKSPLAPKSMFSSIPFGVGARKCPGSRVANTELHFLLINVIRNFTLTKKHSEFPEMETDQSMFYINTNKYPLYFHPREHTKHYFN